MYINFIRDINDDSVDEVNMESIPAYNKTEYEYLTSPQSIKKIP